MLKRSLFSLAVFMLAVRTTAAAGNLFGCIPCLSPGCADTSCSDGCCPDVSCCAPSACSDNGCGESCGESCGADCGALFGNLNCDCLSGLTSVIKKSDHCFDDFISPMTNPVFFEDPRTLTEARMIFVNHNLPGALGGSSAQLYAVQLRFAINEDVSIIATKDGYMVSDNPLLNDGWVDVAAGLKVNVYKDVATQTLLSVGGTFEAPIGSRRTLQGNGDGEFHLFTSGGTKVLDHYHVLSGLGLRLPVDQNAENTMMYWSNHLDRKIGNSKFYVLGECNWYHWLVNGATPIPATGIDIINLGSNSAAGTDIVTAAIGVKYKPSGNTEIGVAWEAPMSDRRDIMKDRLTVDWILRY